MNNTVHKVELRADSKGSRQRVGELNLKFSGIELDLSALTTAANGESFTDLCQLLQIIGAGFLFLLII